MTTSIIIITWASLFGALVNRARGHGWKFSTTGLNRAFYGAGIALVAAVGGLPLYLVAAIGGFAFLSCTLGHGAHQRMHHQTYWATFDKTEKTTRWLPHVFGPWRDNWPVTLKTTYQIIGMSFIGLLRHIILGFPLLIDHWQSYLVFAAHGLAFGPLYWLGWQCIRDWNISWRDWPEPFRAGSDFGDLFVGAWTFGVLAVVLLF